MNKNYHVSVKKMAQQPLWCSEAISEISVFGECLYSYNENCFIINAQALKAFVDYNYDSNIKKIDRLELSNYIINNASVEKIKY